jgi:GDP-L-fucose synthase
LTFFQSKKILVTGGTGMIGRQLVPLLIEAGAEVRVAALDDPSLSDSRTEYRRGDLTDRSFCDEIVAGQDMVFHLAGIKGAAGLSARKPASFFVPLILMNTQMMAAAHTAGVERYLYTSSIAVYEPKAVFVEDEAWDGPPHPSDLFPSWAKRMGELQAEAYKIEHGWDKIAIVRPANVYGPGDDFSPNGMVIPSLIRRVVEGESPLVVWGDGSTVRDFIFSRDVARGMMLAIEKGADCTPMNLGSGDGVAIRDLVAALRNILDDPPEVVWDTDKPTGEPIRLMDLTRAREKIGFQPQTSLEEGVKETFEWYLENGGGADTRFSAFDR